MRKLVSGLSLLAILLPAGAARAQNASAADLFEKKIRPLLAQNCYECHSVTGKEVKGGLRLDTPRGSPAAARTAPSWRPAIPTAAS